MQQNALVVPSIYGRKSSPFMFKRAQEESINQMKPHIPQFDLRNGEEEVYCEILNSKGGTLGNKNSNQAIKPRHKSPVDMFVTLPKTYCLRKKGKERHTRSLC